MMKFAVLASLILGASAFSTVSQKAMTTQLSASTFDNDFGAITPLGFFDPLGLVADGDQEKFNRLRLVEVKHGRISMLAVGNLVRDSGYRLPGDIELSHLKFSNIPN
jgi:Chlorophyll A-B binding protein